MALNQKMRERVLRNEAIRTWISKRAYELHQLGGWDHGRSAEDWIIAESELLALASVLEEVFRSKATPKKDINEARDADVPAKSQRRRARSASAPTSEAPTISDKIVADGSQASPRQESINKKKSRSKRAG